MLRHSYNLTANSFLGRYAVFLYRRSEKHLKDQNVENHCFREMLTGTNVLIDALHPIISISKVTL